MEDKQILKQKTSQQLLWKEKCMVMITPQLKNQKVYWEVSNSRKIYNNNILSR